MILEVGLAYNTCSLSAYYNSSRGMSRKVGGKKGSWCWPRRNGYTEGKGEWDIPGSRDRLSKHPYTALLDHPTNRKVSNLDKLWDAILDISDGKIHDEQGNQASSKENEYLPTASDLSLKSEHPALHDDVKETNDNDWSVTTGEGLTLPTMLDIYDERPEHELDLDNIDKTFPPRNFAISDCNVGRICGTKLRIAEPATRRPSLAWIPFKGDRGICNGSSLSIENQRGWPNVDHICKLRHAFVWEKDKAHWSSA